MTPVEQLRELMGKATPLPWTGQCLGGRELADAGILADVESVSSPFARANHIDDLAFAVEAINAIPALLAVVEAAQKLSVRAYSCGPIHEIGVELHAINNALVSLTTPTKAP